MDISTRQDIEKVVYHFYDQVMQDPGLGPIFLEVMKVDWNKHLPIMVDFWETILLGRQAYIRDTMGAHFNVNRKVPLRDEHFNRWIELFEASLDGHFSGEVTENAKRRARTIAEVMRIKMNQENSDRPA